MRASPQSSGLEQVIGNAIDHFSNQQLRTPKYKNKVQKQAANCNPEDQNELFNQIAFKAAKYDELELKFKKIEQELREAKLRA